MLSSNSLELIQFRDCPNGNLISDLIRKLGKQTEEAIEKHNREICPDSIFTLNRFEKQNTPNPISRFWDLVESMDQKRFQLCYFRTN